MKKVVLFMVMMVAGSMLLQAQERPDSYLQDITNVVKELRKGNNTAINSAIATLSADKKPKITLMDEIKWGGDQEEKLNEVKGAQGNRFKLNQVVAYVYKKQNHQLESKSNMLNGNEKDIHYSIIEKSVKRGGKVTYTIKGRSGKQDFMFVPFNPKSKYVVYMQGERTPATDVCHIHLDRVSKDEVITFSILYLDDKVNKDLVESFAILNYNPQK